MGFCHRLQTQVSQYHVFRYSTKTHEVFVVLYASPPTQQKITLLVDMGCIARMDDRRGIQFLDHYRTGHHITPTQVVTIHNRAGGEPRRLTEPHWTVALHSLLHVSSSMRESLKLGFWADAEAIPGLGGIKIVGMPNSRAKALACSGPAPPNATKTKSRGS